jgi:putative nucleotidyltransferase with HDIG domain
MASGTQRRTRWERVAALELPPGRWDRAWASLRRGDVLARVGLGVGAAVLLCVAVCGWSPPFAYRTGQVLPQSVAARVPFEAVDRSSTDTARDRARRQTASVYVLDPQPLDRIPSLLVAAVDEAMAADGYGDPGLQKIWGNFQAGDTASSLSEEESLMRFEKFRVALGEFWRPDDLRRGVEAALAPFRETGLLLEKPSQGNRAVIVVYPAGHREAPREVRVADVLVVPDSPLHRGLCRELNNRDLADPAFAWIRHRLAVTPLLKLDEHETFRAIEEAAAAVDDVVVNYAPGQTLAVAGQPLGEDEIRLLRLEHEATLARRPLEARLLRAGAVTALILALFALAAVYLHRCERLLLVHLGRFATMLALIVLCVVLATWAADDAWRAEVIPVLVFGQIVAIAYRQEVALVLSAVVALVLAAATGQVLSGFLLGMGVTATAVLHLGSIRTRSKLTYVGLSAGVAAILLTVGLAVLDGQPVNQTLFATAGCNGLWALAAAFVLTVLLPFVERWFGVLTDLSLLELADVSHPLLQELVRRAPSTYNHSITVGSIAEAAAEAIGARGLLTRVGAYYHDIGKMLKPGYFVENQARDANRHESLAPAMSTLVIISHVKDGADLARQHGLPQPIIDFIEQHHGTTLVEYFYSRATEQCQQNPNGGEVDENLYRYPGPKPQTREAGVLMLADSVESASRALVDPAPSRIEGLVREVAERKLDDGQFDESGLTLRELRTIEDSMIKSLIANYHGRVKYPEPKSA